MNPADDGYLLLLFLALVALLSILKTELRQAVRHEVSVR